ncbi:Phosducin-like protein 3 [Rhizophlyctis rosea]|uniref:Phosducin-like protein 3 n=1 Tax=Rhizophlyctis rosea TaxID=64517 RepID=A0AAD5SFU3_9FUNG|nr:Phosducin-like protein 3 [Rhizophlyctis rosea]
MAGEDTEWDQILRDKGILPAKEKEPEITEDELIAMVEKAVAAKYGDKPIEDRTLDELDELEDEEDERVLESYRRQRLAEMQALSSLEKYGTVTELSKPDYNREVTEASQSVYVVLHLYQNHIPACKLINGILDRIASNHRYVKFMRIRGDQCIENYPDRNCPTLLVYGEGDLKRNLVGIASLGGMGTTIDYVEKLLKDCGALKSLTTHGEDEDAEEQRRGFRISRATKQDDSDDDWD